VGGRGYAWNKITTCKTQRREKLITCMACYTPIAVTKYGKACAVEDQKDELLANINLYFKLK